VNRSRLAAALVVGGGVRHCAQQRFFVVSSGLPMLSPRPPLPLLLLHLPPPLHLLLPLLLLPLLLLPLAAAPCFGPNRHDLKRQNRLCPCPPTIAALLPCAQVLPSQ